MAGSPAPAPGGGGRLPILLMALGLLHLGAAMALWIVAAAQAWTFAPGRDHLALVIQAFQGCFLLGVLSACLPRWLAAPASGPCWGSAVLALAVAGPIAIAGGAIQLLPWLRLLLHLAALALLLRCMLQGGRRLGVELVVLAVALATVLAADLVELGDRGPGSLAPWLRSSAQGLLLQGLPLVLVGVLGARLWSGRAPPGLASWGLVLGALALLASYPMAAVAAYGDGAWRAAWALRALAAAVLLAPLLRLRRPIRAEAWAVAGAAGSILLGLGLAVLLPQYRVAWQHLIFVTGFLWLILLLAGRGLARGRQPRPWLLWTWSGLLIMANLTRIGAEWSLQSYALHLWLGATIGLLALALWPWGYLLRGPQAGRDV